MSSVGSLSAANSVNSASSANSAVEAVVLQRGTVHATISIVVASVTTSQSFPDEPFRLIALQFANR